MSSRRAAGVRAVLRSRARVRACNIYSAQSAASTHYLSPAQKQDAARNRRGQAHLGANDGCAAAQRHYVFDARLGLAQHRHHAGDLDDRILLRLREVAAPPRAFDVNGQNAQGRDARPLACQVQRRRRQQQGAGAGRRGSCTLEGHCWITSCMRAGLTGKAQLSSQLRTPAAGYHVHA